MNRTYDERHDRVRYHGVRPGVYAIIVAPGGLLVTVQERPWPEFQLPGGGVDPGEQPLAALHREVYEESGYRLHQPRRLGMFHRYTYMPEYDRHAHKQCTIYLAKLGRRIAPPIEPGHWAVQLPWEEAADVLAVAGDRYFVGSVGKKLGCLA